MIMVLSMFVQKMSFKMHLYLCGFIAETV